MLEGQAAAIRGEHDFLKDWVTSTIDKYRDVYPGLHENYTLLMLLVLVDKDAVDLMAEDVLRASRYELTNLTSLHRAITDAKKEYESRESRIANLEKAAETAKALGADGGESWPAESF